MNYNTKPFISPGEQMSDDWKKSEDYMTLTTNNNEKQKISKFISYLDNFEDFLEFVSESYYDKIAEKLANKIKNNKDINNLPEMKGFWAAIELANKRGDPFIGEGMNREEIVYFVRTVKTLLESAQQRLPDNPFPKITNDHFDHAKKRMDDGSMTINGWWLDKHFGGW